jgi:hypothetical protein
MKQAMSKTIKVYYQTITPESAEHGDFSDTGEHDVLDCNPDKHDTADGLTAVDLAVKELKKQYLEASSSNFHRGIWFTSIDPDQNYSTGEETYYTFHLKGFTKEEEQLIYKKIFNKGA